MSKKIFNLLSLLIVTVLLLSACSAPAATPTPSDNASEGTTATESPDTNSGGSGEMTEVGTPRSETLIVQTFDGKVDVPDNFNPLTRGYVLWRGFRELAWGYLWEMDTATGESYPELAADMPKILDDQHTQFQISLKQGIYWSDGVEFTADDVIYTLDTYRAGQDKLTYWGIPAINGYVKSYKKLDNYTLEIETTKPAYDFVTMIGVYTWGSNFNILPKHIYESVDDLSTFKNPNPVSLGAYVLKSFDPNGQWHLWERREDWQRSSTGWMGEPAAKYVFYKNFGDEQTRTLAFIKNQYDVDTFMSPDGIAAAQAQNSLIKTFAPTMPYHDMGDACSYGIIMNQQKAPLDNANVRWALALSLDLKNVGFNSMNGQFRASALPMPETQITNPAYFAPLSQWLTDFTLEDGYKPWDPNFASDMVKKMSDSGMDASMLPSGDDVTKSYGMGWWKYDPAESEKLMATAGYTKNADGFYADSTGKVWEVELVIPSDWNKVMQRVGFSIADSWNKAGFKTNARQVDNGEFTKVQNTNTLLTTMVNWSTSCVFNTNYIQNWRSFSGEYLKPVDSNEEISGNSMRITDEKVFSLIADAAAMDMSQPEFLQSGQEIVKEMLSQMMYINMMNIPTTIPTNDTYWTNFPKADNAYAVPYTWWSSFKKILVTIKPTGK